MPPRSPGTFALAVLGCRANQEELEALRSQLLARGAREVPYPGPADLVVVNTCAVTASAQAQSRQAVRRAGRCAPRCLVVTGCGAQLDPRGFAALPGVRWVVGNRAKDGIVEAIDGALESPEFPARIDWTDDPSPTRFLKRVGTTPPRRTRALLKVQDGCDLDCAYCIVPRLRGRPVSRDAAEVIAEARRLVDGGAREIVLTGVNLGLYGRGGEGLEGLLVRLEDVVGPARIRLSSLEPMTLTDALLDRFAASSRICAHLHLPLQSGDDAVLQRMGRPYDAAGFRELIERIVRARPRIGLGVDVVAGFPGETEAAFASTLELLETLPITYLHAFGFSSRPGTRAAALSDPVPVPVRRARVRALRELDARLRHRFRARLRGARAAVLVERVRDGVFEGLTGEYVRVRGRQTGVASGDVIEVVL
jgi:threonylcarbamoyladenosine tRNA methylthiotransferase MtaB